MATYYLTTPIYYVNDLPHIGHIYTTVVTDTLARYLRLRGHEVRFLTGTDEHGQKIERAAAAKGVEPLALADRVVSRYHELWSEYRVSHDDFIRTTEERHRAGVEKLIERLEAAGDLYRGAHEGWYCAACETYYTEKELAAGNLCPVHESAAEWRSEENVYFRLSRYQQPLLDWYAEHPDCVQPKSRANEVRSFVEGGLNDLSVSRASLSWGIPFPGHEGQTVYVWLDALSNYITALGYGSGDDALYQQFWGSEIAHRLQLIGKDILRFHAVYWPAFLMSAGLPLPTTVWAHGWWLRDERKISKSVGNLVRPDALVASFGPDPLRYFLLREMVFGQDAQFSDESFVDRYNSDLANDLGNTVSRLVNLSRSAFDGKTPPEACGANPLITLAEEALGRYHAAMGELAFHRALAALWEILAATNQYLVAQEPWKVVKSEGATAAVSRVLWNGLEAARLVATGLLPFLPQLAPRVLAALGVSTPPASFETLTWGGLPLGAELPEPAPLFPRIDKEGYLSGQVEITPPPPPAPPSDKETSLISIDQFFQTQLRVATIMAAEKHPNADRLLQLTVSLGEGETRTLVAGIAQQYEPEALVGRQVVVVANLEPAKLRGVVSEGMVLAASVDGKPVLLAPDARVPDGTPVK
jgi:methionyl-tRNA synthetase